MKRWRKVFLIPLVLACIFISSTSTTAPANALNGSLECILFDGYATNSSQMPDRCHTGNGPDCKDSGGNWDCTIGSNKYVASQGGASFCAGLNDDEMSEPKEQYSGRTVYPTYLKVKACYRVGGYCDKPSAASEKAKCSKAVNKNDQDRIDDNTKSHPFVTRICVNNDGSQMSGELYTTCQNAVVQAYEYCKGGANLSLCMFNQLKGKYGLSGKSDEDAKKIVDGAETQGAEDQAKLEACKTDVSKCEDESSCKTYGGGTWDNNAKKCNKNEDKSNTTEKTSCEVSGVGWFICPISLFLGGIADAFYSWIDGFLEVNSAAVFGAGAGLNAYRNFLPLANILLAIIFVLIIYSEATGNGFGALSNYSVKKLLPRLVVFAVLINISWYLCAAAVDLSNIIGVNMKGFFEGVNGSISGADEYNGTKQIWSSVVTGALVGTVFGISVAATGGSAAITAIALVLLLLLVAVIILAVITLILIIRQAGIIMLSVISPLAFAMAMLPNTKKLFDKWLSAFMALLITWPAVAVVFGGSEVASTVIDSAGKEDWIMKLVAVAVKVVPLIATPFLILGCLKAFGKAGEMISGRASNMMIRGKNSPLGRYKSFAKDRMGGDMNRWQYRSAQKAQAGGKAGKFRLGNLVLKARQMSYNNKAEQDETQKALQQTLEANHEKKASTEGTQEYNTRMELNRSELSLDTAKAASEGIKQAAIANSPELQALNNQKLAAEAGGAGWQQQQNIKYREAIKENDGNNPLARIASAGGDVSVAVGKSISDVDDYNKKLVSGFESYFKGKSPTELAKMLNSNQISDPNARKAAFSLIGKNTDMDSRMAAYDSLLASGNLDNQKLAAEAVQADKDLAKAFPQYGIAAGQALAELSKSGGQSSATLNGFTGATDVMQASTVAAMSSGGMNNLSTSKLVGMDVRAWNAMNSVDSDTTHELADHAKADQRAYSGRAMTNGVDKYATGGPVNPK